MQVQLLQEIGDDMLNMSEYQFNNAANAFLFFFGT